MTDVTALIPLRSPGAGKSRLAGHLSMQERAELTAAMLTDVVGALHASTVMRVVVAAAGDRARRAAEGLGVDVIADPPDCRSLDDALAAAAGQLAVRDLLVVMADLPALGPGDVAALLAVDAAVTVAPAADGGTGALRRRPSDVIPTAYGPGSAARHLAAGEAAGVPTSSISLPGFRVDVDTATDLAMLAGRPVGRSTARLLEQLDLRPDPASRRRMDSQPSNT